MAKPQILIVDDDAVVRRALRRTAEIELAGDGSEALAAILGGRRFHVILSDITMPRMSGLELFDRVSDAVPQQARRFVFLTGGVIEPLARRLRQTGAPQLEKPVDLVALRAAIERFALDANLV